MFRLLKYLVILKILNPFQRGFSLLRLLGCLVVVGGFLFYYGVPDWLSGMVRGAIGAVESRENSPQYGGGGGYGSGAPSSGGLLADVLGEGEKTVGGVIDSILKRESAPSGNAAPQQGGGLLSDIIGKGETILAGALGGAGKKESGAAAGVGFGPPPDFAGGTVTANPALFAAFARIGATPDQLRTLPDSPMPLSQKPNNVNWQRVSSVVDGDTLLVNGQTVRLIGIDAPESGENEHLARELSRIGARDQSASMLYMGREAANFAKRLAEGRRCWLEFDGPERDQYGRILAYVHLEDGTNLNEAILYQGYAKAYLTGSFRYLKRYIFLQNEAERRGNGLWGK